MKTNQIFSEFNLKFFFSMHEEETSRMRAEKLLPSPSALHRGPDLTNSCEMLTTKHTRSPVQSDKAAAMHRNEACPQEPAALRPMASE